ncbi:MAG: hypothetical protein ACI9G1_003880 [Pirellulaceae bacterium]|jgi:hypothetical protein
MMYRFILAESDKSKMLRLSFRIAATAILAFCCLEASAIGDEPSYLSRTSEEWAGLLRSGDRDQRRRAILTLGEYRPNAEPSADAVLVELLKDPKTDSDALLAIQLLGSHAKESPQLIIRDIEKFDTVYGKHKSALAAIGAPGVAAFVSFLESTEPTPQNALRVNSAISCLSFVEPTISTLIGLMDDPLVGTAAMSTITSVPPETGCAAACAKLIEIFNKPDGELPAFSKSKNRPDQGQRAFILARLSDVAWQQENAKLFFVKHLKDKSSELHRPSLSGLIINFHEDPSIQKIIKSHLQEAVPSFERITIDQLARTNADINPYMTEILSIIADKRRLSRTVVRLLSRPNSIDDFSIEDLVSIYVSLMPLRLDYDLALFEHRLAYSKNLAAGVRVALQRYAASPAQLTATLRLIHEFQIEEAYQPASKFFTHSDPSVKKAVWEILALPDAPELVSAELLSAGDTGPISNPLHASVYAKSTTDIDSVAQRLLMGFELNRRNEFLPALARFHRADARIERAIVDHILKSFKPRETIRFLENEPTMWLIGVRALINSENPQSLTQVLNYLSSTPMARLLEKEIRPLFKHSSPQIARSAIALVAKWDRSMVSYCIDLFEESEDFGMKIASAEVIAKWGNADETAKEYCAKLLKHEDYRFRLPVIFHADRSGLTKEQLFSLATGDASPIIRRYAAVAFYNRGFSSDKIPRPGKRPATKTTLANLAQKHRVSEEKLESCFKTRDWVNQQRVLAWILTTKPEDPEWHRRVMLVIDSKHTPVGQMALQAAWLLKPDPCLESWLFLDGPFDYCHQQQPDKITARGVARLEALLENSLEPFDAEVDLFSPAILLLKVNESQVAKDYLFQQLLRKPSYDRLKTMALHDDRVLPFLRKSLTHPNPTTRSKAADILRGLHRQND